MGGLDYISPDANIVAAFVVKEPTGLVDDLLKFVETASPDFGQHLQKVETEHGINLRKDIAGPLGGEFAFAIDGPILPTPSWKMVFEVNDPAKLQSSLEHIVEEVNRETAKSGFSGLQWENEDLNGFSFHKLRSPQFGLEVNFVYANGYLIAGPSRAVVESALRFHDSGVTLRTSKRFGSSLPADGNANFSAIIYHDLAPLIAPLAQKFGDSAPEASEKQKAIAALAANTPPTLAYAYAQGDRITIASTNEGGPFGLNPTTLLGMPNALDLQHILWSGMRGKENRQP